MRKLLLVLPILAGAAALPGSAVQAVPAAQPARLDTVALTFAMPNTAIETVQYHRDDRREWRHAREEAHRRAEWRQQHRYYR